MEKCKETGRVKPIDLIIGETYNSWTILGFSHKNSSGNLFWECKCVCGIIKTVGGGRIFRGESKSCGCYRKRKGQNIKHGLKHHPLYNVWGSMKYRCYNKKAENYPDYGGRGITVCDEWRYDFKRFYDDMIEGYIKGEVELDRYPNNDGNYEKSNCRWATPIQNANNKRVSKYLTLNGIVRTASEWGRYLGIKDDTIRSRKYKGYSDSECLSISPLPMRKTI